MKFQCGHCGRVLRVADAQAGRRGKCPRCKQVVTIPAPVPKDSVTEGQPSSSDEVTAGASPRDGLLLDMPPADATSEPAAEPETADEAYRKLRAMYGGRVMEPEEIPQRKLPWIVDIFLYPMSKSGLLILSLSAGIPLVLRVVLKFFKIFSAAFPPMMTFWILAIIAHWAAFAMFLWYMAWYVCQCIRDSAESGIRAADTTSSTPGLGELLWRVFAVIVTAVACMGPALIYLARSRSLDQTFWTLYGIGGFVFPMALLAVVMFESLRGLNPLLVFPSILSAPFRYTAVVVFCYPLCALLPVAIYYAYAHWTVGYFLLFLAYYQLLILAHLLGRFFWKSQERLNWDV